LFAKHFKKWNVLCKFPLFSLKKSVQVFMLSEALSHVLYWNQACARQTQAVIPVKPAAKGFTFHRHFPSYGFQSVLWKIGKKMS
jgi:hypothetical protein